MVRRALLPALALALAACGSVAAPAQTAVPPAATASPLPTSSPAPAAAQATAPPPPTSSPAAPTVTAAPTAPEPAAESTGTPAVGATATALPTAAAQSTAAPVATAAPAATSGPAAGAAGRHVQQAIADLAARLSIDPGAIAVLRAEQVEWPDGSLGCPREGMGYTQALVSGVFVQLEAGGQTYNYHGSSGDEPFLCTSKDEVLPEQLPPGLRGGDT